MARDFYINGEALVRVKGHSASLIANVSELGLSNAQIRVTPQFRHKDIGVEAWGDAPPEVQVMLGTVSVTMTLVHFDPDVLNECLRLSQAGPSAGNPGVLPHAGTRLGGGVARFAPGNNFMGLNISSTAALRPWRFFFSYLTGPPMEFPLGNEKSIVTLNWRVIPYTIDPWNSGLGAFGSVLYDNGADS
jgi:hypothetical protein